MMWSNSGSSGLTTKSSAPVMSTVRWPSAAMLAHAADRGRERLGEDEVAEHLGRVGVDLVDRGVLEAAVEVAQEVAAVAAVERQQGGRFEQRACSDEPRRGRRCCRRRRREPRVGGHDVRRDERVLEVERRELAGGVEHLRAQALAARWARPWRRARSWHAAWCTTVGRWTSCDVVRPVDDAGIEREVALVVGVERLPEPEQAIEAVDRLALGVRAVELDVAEGAVERARASPRARRRTPPGGRAAAATRRSFSARASAACARGRAVARRRPRPGNAHSDTAMAWPAVVVERVLGEPLAHEVDEAAVAQRVDRTGRHLHDIGLAGVGRPGLGRRRRRSRRRRGRRG